MKIQFKIWKEKVEWLNLASCQFCRVVDSAIKLHFVSYITSSPGVKEGTSLWNGTIMTEECNLYVTYSALLGVSDNIIKIMPVHKNHDFLAVRMCELWVPVYRYLVYQCLFKTTPLPSIFFGSNPYNFLSICWWQALNQFGGRNDRGHRYFWVGGSLLCESY